MAKLRVTFEIDNTALFDVLHSLGGSTDAIGARLVGGPANAKQ